MHNDNHVSSKNKKNVIRGSIINVINILLLIVWTRKTD